jgi:hypothetical protein
MISLGVGLVVAFIIIAAIGVFMFNIRSDNYENIWSAMILIGGFGAAITLLLILCALGMMAMSQHLLAKSV